MTTSTLLIAFACLLAGAGLGAFFTRRFSPQERERRELAESLHRQEAEAAAYQQQVTAHFIKTSELVNNLAQSYREVHQHLALSATHLANPEVGRSLLNAGTGQLELNLDAKSQVRTLEPPRDYSTKKDMLNPGYSLQDTAGTMNPIKMTAGAQHLELTADNDEDDPTLKVG